MRKSMMRVFLFFTYVNVSSFFNRLQRLAVPRLIVVQRERKLVVFLITRRGGRVGR